MLAVVAVRGDEAAEKPEGEPVTIGIEESAAPTPRPTMGFCKGGCPPSCAYPRICKSVQAERECRAA